MKNFLVVITLISISSWSQKMSGDFDLTWQDVELHRSKNSKLVDAFYKDGEYFVLRKEVIRGPGGWYYFLEKFDQGLNRVEVKDISMNIDEENYRTQGIEKMGDNFVIISSNYDKGEQRETYYAQVLQTENMSLGKRSKIIAFDNVKGRRGLALTFVSSPDNSFAAIYFIERERKGKTSQFSCYVFDENMEMLWKREDYNLDETWIREVFFDNEASISLVVSKSADRKWIFGGEDAETDVVNFQIHTEDGVEEIQYKFNDYEPGALAVSRLDNGNFVLSGYYYEPEGRVLEGVYCVTIDSRTGEMIDDIHKEFSDELLKEGESERAQKKHDKRSDKGKNQGANNLEMMEILYHDDGSFSMIGERNWLVVSTTTDANGNTRTTYTYYRTDMIVTTIKDGEIVSNVKINKFATAGSPFTGYQAISHNNIVYVFFKDHRENIIAIDEKVGVLRYPRKNKHKALVVMRIEGESKSREGIIDYGNKLYEPYRTYNLGYDVELLNNNDILCWTYKGKKRFALLRISPK